MTDIALLRCPFERCDAATLRTEVVHDVDALPFEWDELVGDRSLIHQRHYLEALERCPPPRTRLVLALAWDGPLLRAAAVFHLVELRVGELGRTASESSWPVRAFLRTMGTLGLGTPHMLLCGNVLHSDASGLVCSGVENPAALLHSMTETVRHQARVPVRLVVCTAPDVGPHHIDLPGLGYHRVSTAQPTMRLDIPPEWTSWADYLAALRTKYRQRAKSARKRGKALVRTRLTADEIIEKADVIDGLLAPVLERAEVVLAPITATSLAALQRQLGDEMQLVLYVHDDQPVGFAVSLRHSGELDAMVVGLDDACNRDLKLYQNILYDYVEHAIHTGASTVAFGRCALEIKSTVGASPHHFDVFVRHPRWLAHTVLGGVLRWLTADQWTPRSPFKIA